MESKVEWDSMKKGFFDDSKQRTKDLVNKMKNKMTTGGGYSVSQHFSLQKCKHIQYQGNNTFTSGNNIQQIINNAIATLEKNPKMLEYNFSDDKALEGIIVHSYVDLFQQFSTEDDDICGKACDVYAAIQIVLDDLYQQVSSSSVPRTIPYVTLSEKLSGKCNFGSTAQIYGGSKSRRRHNRHRKHVRKTRRGRGIKSKSKRHVRGRKNKKNTYTRRR